jgi:hypothetical protein
LFQSTGKVSKSPWQCCSLRIIFWHFHKKCTYRFFINDYFGEFESFDESATPAPPPPDENPFDVKRPFLKLLTLERDLNRGESFMREGRGGEDKSRSSGETWWKYPSLTSFLLIILRKILRSKCFALCHYWILTQKSSLNQDFICKLIWNHVILDQLNMPNRFSLYKFIPIFFNWLRFYIYFALHYDLYPVNTYLNFLDDLILIVYSYLFIIWLWQFSFF